MTDDRSWMVLVSGDRRALLPPAIMLLAEGAPVPLRRLAAAADWTEERVAAALQAIPRVDRDDDGNLTGLGLTLAPTVHRVTIDGHQLYTWCAVDSLALPVILGRSVSVESICPTSGRTIRVSLTPQGVRSAAPQQAVITEVPPAAGCDDFRSSVCDHGHFFVDAAAAEPWCLEHPTGQIRSIAAAFTIVRTRLLDLGWTTAVSRT